MYPDAANFASLRRSRSKALCGAMKAEAVDLDDELGLAPQEVDLVSVKRHVGLGRGKLRGADQRQEAFLGL
jgi:hypothetical protein